MAWQKLVRLSLCALLLSSLAVAQLNKFGIAGKYTAHFSDPVRVGGALLPKGNYEIRHNMKNGEHFMIFRQLVKEKPVEVRAKCTLVPLSEPASETRSSYVMNDANERVLQEMTFKGDTAKHVF